MAPTIPILRQTCGEPTPAVTAVLRPLAVGLMGLALILASAVSTGAAETTAGASVAAQLLKLTGGRHMRIVWMQRVGPLPPSDPVWLPASADYRLMTFDTTDGKERELLPGPTKCYAPKLTKDGKSVIWFEWPGAVVSGNSGEALATGGASSFIAWDGKGGPKRLIEGGGWVVDTWQDPVTRTQWAYASLSADGGKSYGTSRVRIDKPTIIEPIFDEPSFNNGRFISGDGKRICGSFGAGANCGVADLTLKDGSWKLYQQGCWPNIAPDASYRAWVFTGSHREVVMFDKDGENKRTVAVNTMPGVDGNADVYAPRWTNDPRLFVVSGPLHGAGSNMSDRAEIYVGKFDERFTKVTDWVRVTDNSVYDSYADGLVAPAAVSKTH